MKKMRYILLLLIPTFFMLLSGCSNLSITTTKNTYQPSGLVAVVKGKATKADKVTYKVNGITKKVKMNDGHFAFSVPASYKNQNVKIVASDEKTSQTKIVSIQATKKMGDYTAFAQQYNYSTLTLGAGNDQIPLIAEDGIFKYTKPDKTNVYFNVQGTNLMGIAMECSYKAMKDKTAMKSFETNLYMISKLLGANGKSVLKNLNSQLKNMNSGNKTNLNSIDSNGIHFEINLSADAFYIYITK